MLRLLTLGTVTALAINLCADDWSMYLGDVSHSSFRAGETRVNSGNVSQLQPLWTVNLGATISTSATVSNGTVYVGAWDGNFYAIDAASGSVMWQQFVGRAPEPEDHDCMPGIGVASQAAVAGDTVYVAGGDSAVYALNRATGEVRWRVPLADPASGNFLWSSLMPSGNSLYLGLASLGDCPMVRGGLARIDLRNPTQPVIRYLVPEDSLGAGVWSTPALDEQANLLYITTGNADDQDAESGTWGSAMLALDASTLDVKAHFFIPLKPTDADSDWGSSPLLFQTTDGAPYVAASGKNGVMYVLTRPDLSPAWTVKLATDCVAPEQGCGSLSTPAFDGRTIFSGAGLSDDNQSTPGSVYAIDPASRAVLWKYRADGVVLAPVTVTPGLVYAPTTAGLVILDASTGSPLWKDPGPVGLYSQAAVVNGTVFTTYVNGDVTAWTSAGRSVLVPHPSALTFLHTRGGTPVAPQSLQAFSVDAPVGFKLTSDSSWLVLGAAGGTTPAAIEVSVDVARAGPGVYQGKITLEANDGSGSASVPVKLTVNDVLPALAPADVGDSVGFRQATLAPGSLFSIRAASLAGESVAAPAVPWPPVLNGISVKINGIAAPLALVSPTEIDAQAPYELGPGAATLVVESSGARSNPVSLTIAPAAPVILLTEDQRAVAFNEDLSDNAADNPALPGSVLGVLFTGQGQLDNPVNSGEAASFEEVNNTLASTSATVGGQETVVQFSGLIPGFVGVAQASLMVPDLPPGDYPVVLTVGGAVSNAAVVSITNDALGAGAAARRRRTASRAARKR